MAALTDWGRSIWAQLSIRMSSIIRWRSGEILSSVMEISCLSIERFQSSNRHRPHQRHRDRRRAEHRQQAPLLRERLRRRLHLGDSQIAFRLIQDQKREAILSRRTLTDRQWAIIEPLVPGKEGDRGRTGTDNRLFLDAILWLARGASPWRDLPPELGNWRTVHSRFRRWTIAGVWESLFKALSADPDFEYVLVDATICKTHADATSQKGGLKLPVLAAPKAD